MLDVQEVAFKNSLPPSNAIEFETHIIKLRWIGQEDEAIFLHRRLAQPVTGGCAGL